MDPACFTPRPARPRNPSAAGKPNARLPGSRSAGDLRAVPKPQIARQTGTTRTTSRSMRITGARVRITGRKLPASPKSRQTVSRMPTPRGAPPSCGRPFIVGVGIGIGFDRGSTLGFRLRARVSISIPIPIPIPPRPCASPAGVHRGSSDKSEMRPPPGSVTRFRLGFRGLRASWFLGRRAAIQGRPKALTI